MQVRSDIEASISCGLCQSAEGIIIEAGSMALASVPIVSRLRSLGLEQPIMVIASRCSWRESVTCLDAGADDFVIKPVRSEEIAARLRVGMRRSLGLPTSQTDVGRFTFDLSSNSIWLDGQLLDLTRHEFRLLKLLLLKPDNVISAEQIRSTLAYYEAELTTNALEVRIARLRKKLGTDAIKTVRGVGYRINHRARSPASIAEFARAD